MQVGFTLGNLNALASQPHGYMAEFAATILGEISTLTVSILASLVNILFNGTPETLNTSSLLIVIIDLFFAILLPNNAATKGKKI